MVNKKEIHYPITKFVKIMWNFLEGNRLRYAVLTSIRVLSEASQFVIVFLLGMTIDFFTNYQSGDSLNTFYIYVFLIGLIGIIQVITRAYSKLNNSVIGAKTRQKVRQISMAKLLDLELSWHEKEASGSKIQKINQGSNLIYKFFSDFTNNLAIKIIVGIFGSMGIFFFLGWKYALFGFLYILIFLSTEYYFNRKMSHWLDELNKISEKVSGKLHESTSNVLSVKALGLRRRFEESTKNHEEEYYKIWYKMKKTGNIRMEVTKAFAAIGYAFFILLVGFEFVAGVITLGSILIFVAYFEKLRNSLYEVTVMTEDFLIIKSGVGRLMTILDEKVFDKESKDLLEIPKNWKVIEFKNVNFSYKNEAVLNDFNFKIKRGEKIGIVGRSGCGKSTITKLLLGLYEVNSGGIFIDGININKFKNSSITKNITAVLQDSEIFDATLEENIAITSEKINKLFLKKTIKISSLEKVINKLPLGLSTLLGEKGYKVSGGERQRIGIARAVYKNSPVLIMDEATSHLDSETEKRIQENLENELKDKTLIVVAHRLSTLKNLDRIIVMKKGKIVEEGNFKELIKKKSKFYSLYLLQKNH